MKATSWISIEDDCDFSLANIPFGVCSFPPLRPRPRCCTAIGNYAVDLSILAEAGLFSSIIPKVSPTIFAEPTLNSFMSYHKNVWVQVRSILIDFFTDDSDDSHLNRDTFVAKLRRNKELCEAAITPLTNSKNEKIVHMHLPATIGDYTDFYSSREHATNVGTMFRGKENALQPNWLHLPVGYHGRSSSIVVSGTDVFRPCGQMQKDMKNSRFGSKFGPSQMLDFELEMAFFIGGICPHIKKTTACNDKTISMKEASDRIFGYVLMNDWSARDIQKWEYVPLGPFTSKNFCTSISPWVVTTMALEPFSCPSSTGKGINAQTEPKPLEYLQDHLYSSYDINLSASLKGRELKKPKQICQTNFKYIYWNAKQQLVHHSVTGCPMRPGDLLASGTISGENSNSFGSMLELCWNGTKPISLDENDDGPTNKRTFLKDYDTVIIEGFAQNSIDRCKERVGFGSCIGTILPPNINTSYPSLNSLNTENNKYKNLILYGSFDTQFGHTRSIFAALSAKDLSFQFIDVDRTKHEMKDDCVFECLDCSSGRLVKLSQLMSILHFLENAYPTRGYSLFPKNVNECSTACEIAGLSLQLTNNLHLLSTLRKDYPVDKVSTQNHAEAVALDARIQKINSLLDGNRSCKGPFACGRFSPSIADMCLFPLLLNLQDYGLKLERRFPTLFQLEQDCKDYPWFQRP